MGILLRDPYSMYSKVTLYTVHTLVYMYLRNLLRPDHNITGNEMMVDKGHYCIPKFSGYRINWIQVKFWVHWTFNFLKNMVNGCAWTTSAGAFRGRPAVGSLHECQSMSWRTRPVQGMSRCISPTKWRVQHQAARGDNESTALFMRLRMALPKTGHLKMGKLVYTPLQLRLFTLFFPDPWWISLPSAEHQRSTLKIAELGKSRKKTSSWSFAPNLGTWLCGTCDIK